MSSSDVLMRMDSAGRVIDWSPLASEVFGWAAEEVIGRMPVELQAFLRGRGYQEPPDITARICGICPVSHMLASAKAGDAILAHAVPSRGPRRSCSPPSIFLKNPVWVPPVFLNCAARRASSSAPVSCFRRT